MKKFTLILTVSFAIIIISACGGNTAQLAPEPVPATEAASQPTEAPPTEATATEIPPTEVPATEIPVTEVAASEVAESESVSYASQIQPIFNTKCISCHGIKAIKEGLDMRTYESTMAGSFNGAVIVPGDAANSFAVEQIESGEMPWRGRAPKVTPEELQLIIDWVNQGAQNN